MQVKKAGWSINDDMIVLPCASASAAAVSKHTRGTIRFEMVAPLVAPLLH